VTQTQGVVRPIDGYLPSTEDVLKVVAANTEKINRCLISNGLSGGYSPAADPSEVPKFVASLASDNVTRNDLWGFFDTDAATYSHYGYDRPPNQSGGFETLSPPGPQAVIDKCEASAHAGLPGDPDSDPEFLVDIHSLPGRGPEVPLNDSRWLTAQAKWSTCMAAAGFAGYKSPLDSLFDAKWQQTGSDGRASASTEQIATATADIICKQKTNLVGIGLAVQSAYDQRYIQSNTQALNEFRTKISAYLSGE
jgi:hypothetical protein